MKNLFIFSLSCYSVFVFGQTTIAPEQNEKIALIGANVHTGLGDVLQQTNLIFDKGKIVYLGNDPGRLNGCRQIDVHGKEIYPGLIAAGTQLGLIEIEQVKATHDEREFGDYNPNVSSLRSYAADSKIIPTLRSNGILLAEVIPSGGIITGQSSIVQLDAWNWEDAAYQENFALHLDWPEDRKSVFKKDNNSGNKENSYSKKIDELDQYFLAAQSYANDTKQSGRHLAFEAMAGLFNQTKKLIIHVDDAKQIEQAVLFAEKFNIHPIINGAREAWRIPQFLKAHNVPVILHQAQQLPYREDDDVDLSYKHAKLLFDSGILYCLKIDGFWQVRNLAFQAGETAAYGLSKEQALQSISYNAAKILGIEKKTGSLEIGKDANIIVSTGDLLDMKTNNIILAFIQGRQIDLDDKQKVLYRKYKNKYDADRAK